MLNGEWKVVMPSEKFIKINRSGQTERLAHFWLFLFTKTSSLKIPTAFGIIPANAPRHR